MGLPIAPTDYRWDATAARARVEAFCAGKPASLRRAFLGDHLIADVIGARLHLVPAAVAQLAGRRGVGMDAPEEIVVAIERSYTLIRAKFEDWPACPLTTITAAASGQPWSGVIAIEGEPTGDGRMFGVNALTWDSDPIPLIVNLDEMGHTGAVVGTLDKVERVGHEIIGHGALSASENPDTQAVITRVAELLDEGAVGVSVLVDSVEDDSAEIDWEKNPDAVVTTTAARIRHVAIVDVPAFADAKIALVAAAPEAWFANPAFGGTQAGKDNDDARLVWQEPERGEEEGQFGAPLTVTDDGQIFGHAALWGKCHVGYAGTCVRPPREPAAYKGFLTGWRSGVPTGPLIMKTSHAPDHQDAVAASQHYAHTGFAVGDVTIGADAYGIWVAGAVRLDATEAQIETLRGSALSGDWRPIGGKHRLIGLLAVNGPGFRVSRALAASGSLVTVGPGCTACQGEVEGEGLTLEARVEVLEQTLLSTLTSGL